MMKASIISSLCCAVLLLVSVDAFCPSNVIARSARSAKRASPDAQEQETTTTGASNNGLARFFAFIAASVFAFHPMATLADPSTPENLTIRRNSLYFPVALTGRISKLMKRISLSLIFCCAF
jgi:hypothetical protein